MNTSQRRIIAVVKKQLQAEFIGEGSGHDWWHIERVYKLAIKIVKLEKKKVNLFVVELAALLHDLEDWKFQNENDSATLPRTRKLLVDAGVDKGTVDRVVDIIGAVSYKLGTNTRKIESLEGQIVQDADRLDAIGAIGIARVFAYGGMKGREIYNPRIKPKKYKSIEEYKKHGDENTSINHFYEKLLLIKDKLNTDSAKKIAQERHDFLLNFLERFHKETK